MKKVVFYEKDWRRIVLLVKRRSNRKKFEILKYDIGKKERKSIQNPDGSGTTIIENDLHHRSVCSLNDNQLRQLYDLGLKLEKEFNYPQDIEWAIQNDIVHVLQTRPITT